MKEKKILRTIVSLCLTVIILLGMLPVMPVLAAPKGLTLDQMMMKFPHGKYWNGGNPDGWTNTPCTHHGYCGSYDGRCGCNSFMGMSIQCMGFAEKLGYDATGYNPRLNANGWYTYTSVSALNNLKPGDIVRRNGHSMYVIGVEGETVTIADCNSRNRSCNIRWGGVTTKSSLRHNFEHVRSAPAPLAIGYLGSCSTYTSSGSVLLEQDAELMNYPCTAATYEDSEMVARIPLGTRLTVVNVLENSLGEYWYAVEWEGSRCYFPAKNAGPFLANVGTVSAANIAAPANVREGRSFQLRGEVTSQVLPLSQVTASVFEGTAPGAEPYLTGEQTQIDSFSYSIAGNAVDNQLTFGKLPAGEYTYLLTAAVTNYYVAEGKLQENQHIFRLHQNTFTISEETPCSHSYAEEVSWEATCGEDGMLTYSCTKCGFAYTQTVFATNEHRLEGGEILEEVSCTQDGTVMMWCEDCLQAYVQVIPAWGHALVIQDAVPVTCTQDGITEGRYCSTCHEVFDVQEAIPATGHKRVEEVIAPTCLEDGYTQIRCENCDELYEQTDVIPALGHKTVIDAAVEPDCDDPGLTEGSHCETCGEVFVPQQELVALGHSYEAEFSWSEDHRSCAAVITCTRDCGAQKQGECTVSVERQEKQFVHTASIQADNETYTDVLTCPAYTVTFQYADGTVIQTEDLHPGDTVTPPEMTDALFTGWDQDITACTEDAVYTAVFAEPEFAMGDLDGDGYVNNEDVVLLLWYTLFPERYPIVGSGDMNGDGFVNNEDVVYLLWHTLFPDRYPLPPV